MRKFYLFGYREWAKDIILELRTKFPNKIYGVISNKAEYDEFIKKTVLDEFSCLIFIGWSWIIESKIVDNFLCLGVHPSDLPYFRGGSPIQNQIIRGVIDSKVSLFQLSSKLDAGDIWAKESLQFLGNSMDEIFIEIKKSSFKLLFDFIESNQNYNPESQNLSIGSYYNRRTPKDSVVKFSDFHKMTLNDIYNYSRCLTDPYPNFTVEDESGNKLVFKHVEYIRGDKHLD